jgi:hypothetical protein
METIFLNKTAGRHIQEYNGTRTRERRAKCQIVETSSTSRMDFIIVEDSETNSGLRSNSPFHYHANVPKVNHV